MTKTPQITILGIGNILLKDDGVGVRVVERLLAQYRFPENVTVYDGGVTGLMGLLPIMEDSDHLIVVDAIHGEGPPGTLYRYDLAEFKLRIPKKLSMHDVGFVECLTVAEVNGSLPDTTVVVGVQPEDFSGLEMGLTETVQRAVGPLVHSIIAELKALGVTSQPAG